MTPSASIVGTESSPAVPVPQPDAVQANVALTAADPTFTISLPDVGGPSWSWSASTTVAWLSPTTPSGTTPNDLQVSVAVAALSPGLNGGRLDIELSIEDYVVVYPVEFSITATEGGSSAIAAVEVIPQSIVMFPGLTLQFLAEGYDVDNSFVDFTPTWSATGGEIDADGYYTAGNIPGSYQVRASDPGSGNSGVADVQILGSLGITTDGTIPDVYEIRQNYPNPFNPTTAIPFDVPEPADVSLRIFNVLGREVMTLVNEALVPGRYTVSFEAAALPSGPYFYLLEAGGFKQGRTMMLLR
jgi:hypothetical protein